MTIHLPDLAITEPVLLAPMSGITDLPFRRRVAQFGAGLLVSEMIAGKEIDRVSGKSPERLSHDGNGPMVVQLAGCEPGHMHDAARRCVDKGADLIDINMGCPAKKVVNGIGGAALMRDEALARQIMDATVAGAGKVPVSLKMRTGWDHGARNAPQLARLAEDAGIVMITVHGRTRKQFYDGHADWDFIAQVKAAVSLPIIANGDVSNADDAREILRRSGADGVMVGRAARGRPWLLRQIMDGLGNREIREPSLAEKRQVILQHYAEILDFHGEHRGLRIARKHLGWYFAALGGAPEFVRGLQRMSEPEAVCDGIADWFDAPRWAA